MRILVLGGYGLIGAAVVRRLLADGHHVTGLGRDVRAARRRLPAAEWLEADLSALVDAASWRSILAGARPEAIVNCAGALQDGLRDDVVAVQLGAMVALYEAAERAGVSRFVQISAPRADEGSETRFMRSKGAADAALARTKLAWSILRPGLVLAPEAYGGTALLRALSAFPVIQPLVLPNARLQTVAVHDVAAAVVDCLSGRVPSRRTFDLVEERTHTLAEVVGRMRAWQGHAPARQIRLPVWLGRGLAKVCDGLGWLGWRAPLRSTALAEIEAGVIGDPEPWRQAGGTPIADLDRTLARLPATLQERWFARAFLVKPLAIATLAAFWIASGVITLAAPDAAAHVLRASGVGAPTAYGIAIGGALLDVVLGLAILLRRWLPLAALGMLGTTTAYLMGGTWFVPGLWLDPLGPLVKAIPAAVLAVVVLALAEDR